MNRKTNQFVESFIEHNEYHYVYTYSAMYYLPMTKNLTFSLLYFPFFKLKKKKNIKIKSFN